MSVGRVWRSFALTVAVPSSRRCIRSSVGRSRRRCLRRYWRSGWRGAWRFHQVLWCCSCAPWCVFDRHLPCARAMHSIRVSRLGVTCRCLALAVTEHSSTRCERGWGPTVACSLIVSLRGVISTQYVKKTEGQRGEAVVFPVIVPVHLETRCKHTRHAGRKHVVCEQRA